MVLQSYAYPFGYFGRCKFYEILTMLSFYPWFSVSYCLFGFHFKSSQVFAKHGFASVFETCCNAIRDTRCGRFWRKVGSQCGPDCLLNALNHLPDLNNLGDIAV